VFWRTSRRRWDVLGRGIVNRKCGDFSAEVDGVRTHFDCLSFYCRLRELNLMVLAVATNWTDVISEDDTESGWTLKKTRHEDFGPAAP